MLTETNNPKFAALKTDIESHPRLCGYYIVGLVTIETLRADSASQEAILETVIEHFDDDETETDPEFVANHEWSDYEVTGDRARAHAIEALVGGPQIGHAKNTMDESIANDLFDRFVTLCGSNPRFYIGLGIGNQAYVFMHGALVVADNLAGILWIVEDD